MLKLKKFLSVFFILLLISHLSASEQSSLQKKTSIVFATEESDYKNALVKATVDLLAKENLNISFIKTAQLSKKDLSDYKAIIIVGWLHFGKPSKEVRSFLEKTKFQDKLILFTTVGSSTWWRPEQKIDAITSASADQHLAERAAELAGLIKKHLAQ